MNRLVALAILLFPLVALSQIKLNALPTSSGVAGTDYTIDDDSTTTRRATYAQVLAYISSGLNLTVPRGGTGVGSIVGVVKGNGTSPFSPAAAADITSLWSGTCDATSYLRGDGACIAPLTIPSLPATTSPASGDLLMQYSAADAQVEKETLAQLTTYLNSALIIPLGTGVSGTLLAAQFPALTGDVVTSAGALATSISANVVTNTKAAQMPANTIKGNNTGSTANSADLTVPQVQALLGTLPPSSYLETTSMPAAFSWDNTHFPITVQIYNPPGMQRTTASVSVTPESLFDAVSTARSAPSATYYVNCSTGNDSNNGTSSGTPYLTLNKAITSANAGGVATMIRVAGSSSGTLCYRTSGFLGLSPTVDLALMADGGRVTMGTIENFSAPSIDATYGSTYSWSRSNVDRVIDLLQVNRFGNFVELQNVSTAAIANVTPNSWALVAGTLYVHRADGAAVTTTNTRVLLGTLQGMYFRNETNIYVGGITAGDGFDVWGGSTNGGFDIAITTPHSTQHVAAVKDSSFKYAGGFTNNGGVQAIHVDSYNGLAAFFNCTASASGTDGFNFHNANSAAGAYWLVVNGTGYDNGRYNQQSNQGLTSHDTTVGIDVGGYYYQNHGGQVRSINSSQSWLVGTLSREDEGDIVFGGSIPPTAYMVDNTATYWCDRCKTDMPAGTRGFWANGAGTAIHLRNNWPTGLVNYGTGTIDTPGSW